MTFDELYESHQKALSSIQALQQSFDELNHEFGGEHRLYLACCYELEKANVLIREQNQLARERQEHALKTNAEIALLRAVLEMVKTDFCDRYAEHSGRLGIEAEAYSWQISTALTKTPNAEITGG